MSRASVRAYFMLLGGGAVMPTALPPPFDIRDYWLGVEIFDPADAADIFDQWLFEG